MPAIELLILIQDDCRFCEEAKNLAERLAREFPLSIAMKDINTPEGQDLATRGGILFPPGIFIDGEPFCYGRPSERKFRRELETKTEAQKSRWA